MNQKLQHLEVKKLLQEYSFLLIDEQYKQEVIAANKEEFLTRVREANSTPEAVPQSASSERPKRRRIDLNSVDKSTKDKVKHLYREIAKRTHPDRCTDATLHELYVTATEAAEEFDLFALYELCNRLDITHSVDAEDKDILKQRILHKKEELKAIEASFIWLYAHAPSEEHRKKLIDQFVNKHGKKL
jgi:translation initiation factor 2 beta subunit (eIF-2beta)/eIF-5